MEILRDKVHSSNFPFSWEVGHSIHSQPSGMWVYSVLGKNPSAENLHLHLLDRKLNSEKSSKLLKIFQQENMGSWAFVFYLRFQ